MAIKIQGTTIINDVTTYIDLNGTAAVKVPVGTQAQRPTGVAGHLRYSTTDSTFEGHNGTDWGPLGGGADEFARTLATLAL